jgi:glutaryl-CoA dehydrogenase
MEPYEGLDFYDIESLLTEEEIMIRDMVRDWVDEEVIPKIEHACAEGIFLDEWRVALGEMGVLGAPLKGYGCPGLSYVAYGLICQELERGDSQCTQYGISEAKNRRTSTFLRWRVVNTLVALD